MSRVSRPNSPPFVPVSPATAVTPTESVSPLTPDMFSKTPSPAKPGRLSFFKEDGSVVVTAPKTCSIPPCQVQDKFQSLEDLIAAVKSSIVNNPKKIPDFFPRKNSALTYFIRNLRKCMTDVAANFTTSSITFDQALFMVGSQLCEEKFNAAKDLDLEWMIQILGIEPAEFKVYLRELMHALTGCTEFYESNSWLLCKIKFPHEIDLKISFSTQSLDNQIAQSLIDRRIPDELWDIIDNKLIKFKNTELRFLRQNPTIEDYAYALLYLTRKDLTDLRLDPDFMLQMQIALKETHWELTNIKKECAKLLAKKGLPHGGYSVDNNIATVLAFIEKLQAHNEKSFPALATPFYTSNPYGMFAPLPNGKAAAPATPNGFSYAAAAAKKS